ncbi:hypothetical protein [Streptomyces sp. LMG1-1-1.1]|uniref:hypothetical protein n=1 Tax=Streptomyces sp. LMG1-1-1.1 TaxID=3135245 RepID=UPI0034655D7F
MIINEQDPLSQQTLAEWTEATGIPLGVKPLIARRGTEHGSGLETQRRVAERAFAHVQWFRRLQVRWEIRDDPTKPS